MDASIELKCLQCKFEGHENKEIIGFCVDEKCDEKNKFVCSECFFDNHFRHNVIRMKELKNIIQTKNDDYSQYYKEEQKLLKIFDEHELKQKEKITQLKIDIFNKLDKNAIIFKDNIHEKYNKLSSQYIRDFSILKRYKEFMAENNISVQDSDLSKLAELCLNIYNDNEKEKEKTDGNEEKKIKKENDEKMNHDLIVIETNFDNYIKEQSSILINYINENFLKTLNDLFYEKSVFEWCDKKYYTYGFLYQLTNNNTRGTKIIDNNKRTILRSKDKLEDNHIYIIKFKIGLQKNGDFDVGIGKELSGNFYWLREKDTISLTNKGIWNSGSNTGGYTLKNNDIVKLEICTKPGNKTFKGYVNNQSVCSINFNIDDIYIMASIQNISDYIEVLEYKVYKKFVIQ